EGGCCRAPASDAERIRRATVPWGSQGSGSVQAPSTGNRSRTFGLRTSSARPHSSGMSGVIAIVGRPNVGKSALFNRIAGRRIAIVHDEPGVTRDRVTAEAEWKGVPFTLVDTGGIGLRQGEKAEDVILQAAVEQVEIAIASAHVILFVVNVQEGMVPLDQEVAERLRTAGKPVLLAANKADNPASGIAAVDFTPLGFE